MNRFDREKVLIGENHFKKIESSKILVVGVGGVGGYVCEILARCGVGEITIVDFDKIDITNINRQIIALTSNIGKYKVDILKQRLLDINPNLKINVIKEQLTCDNVENIVNNNYDYVIDAIDQIRNKIELICACKKNGLNIISAMGTGNRVDVPQYIVCDVYKTQDDGLAKKVRKLLRERGINKLDVVCSLNKKVNSDIVGSIAYHPSICGITLASFVIEKIIKGENDGSNL